MKNFIFLMLIASNVFGADNSQIVKVFDGTAAKCVTKQDANQHKMGVYSLELINTKVTEDNVYVTVKMKNFQCKRTFTGYRFVPVSAYQTLEYFDFNQDLIKAKPLRVSFRSYVDGQYDLLTDRLAADKMEQVFRLKYNRSDVDFGAKTIDIDFWINKNVAFSRNDVHLFNDSVAFGSYRLKIKK
ncbi:MAG: hypothetical protein COW01_02565 [Bdellovibrionales bacterium CG12_big_fil_rev_8_21_14_0_65_38_15]|nr:MAG: hypothetical protein COW79_08230 [Bdellovibrionales bacterium CG22_combo_CG10-13_8_21_14_all_38_13]PIQ56976.1 MAG: hypothetical protein COW01_02565 [Bdellovibrionales bacterium CG12_big_fil_rev_8_21_14_0_65_38_15]PIR29063.1 MAG: hypothetical protein COV38_12555 [Bdellovibrionales bacterium CG11_big_fil_rev_8_21_14_0_20_38_13]